MNGLNEICSWLMAFGGEAEVLCPSELKEMLLQRAKGIVEKYS